MRALFEQIRIQSGFISGIMCTFQHPINSHATFFVTGCLVSLGNMLWILNIDFKLIALLVWKSIDGLASNKLKNELHNYQISNH